MIKEEMSSVNHEKDKNSKKTDTFMTLLYVKCPENHS